MQPACIGQAIILMNFDEIQHRRQSAADSDAFWMRPPAVRAACARHRPRRRRLDRDRRPRAAIGRLAVRPATAQRVLKAAAALHYLPDTDLWRALRPPPMELAFLLPAGTNRYLRMLGDTSSAPDDALAPYNVHCRCHYVDSFDPARWRAACCATAAARRRPGLHGARTPARARGGRRRSSARGVHVLTLISDLAHSRRAGLCRPRQPRRRAAPRPADRPLRRRAHAARWR